MKDGFSDETVIKIRKQLIEMLRLYKVNCIFKSTDRDHCFDNNHEKANAEYRDLIESGACFEEIIQRVKSHLFNDPWPINDPFHSFKNVQSKCLFRKIDLSLLKEFYQRSVFRLLPTFYFYSPIQNPLRPFIRGFGVRL